MRACVRVCVCVCVKNNANTQNYVDMFWYKSTFIRT